MTSAVIHVIGAGMAGLAAAVTAAERGAKVVLHEATGQAGGRCRSYHDGVLDCVIDNGSHLILGANRATLDLAERCGGTEHLIQVKPACFPFLDLASGQSWTVRPGKVPPVPRHGSALVFDLPRLLWANPRASVTQIVGRSPLYRSLWAPLTEAVLNTEPEAASARLLAVVMRETMAAGEGASRPHLAPNGLSAALVDPVLARLAALGGEIRYRSAVRGLIKGDRVTGLEMTSGPQALGPDDKVILALPSWAAHAICPKTIPDLPTRPIINVHLRLDQPIRLPGGLPLLAVLNGASQWIFVRDNMVSVTISAAGALAAQKAETIAASVWEEIKRIAGVDGALPPWRVVKEKRATIAQDPHTIARRPGAKTASANLFLAGDWTDTGLPCTIEGAIRSGQTAAKLAMAPKTRAK